MADKPNVSVANGVMTVTVANNYTGADGVPFYSKLIWESGPYSNASGDVGAATVGLNLINMIADWIEAKMRNPNATDEMLVADLKKRLGR